MHGILKKRAVQIDSPSDVASKSSTIKMIMEVEATKSMLLWPLSFNGDVLGFIGLDYVQEQNRFSKTHKYILEKAADIIARSFKLRMQAQY